MKKLFVLVLFAFGITFTGFSQTNTYYQNKNVISWDEFTHVSFNGITLGKIMQTKGDTTKVNALFGKSMQYRKSNDPNYTNCNSKFPIRNLGFYNGKCRYNSKTSRLNEMKICDILMYNRYYYWISFGNSDISFSFDELASGMSSLEVESPKVAVKIESKIIHIGDSIDKLGNVKILTDTDGNKSIEFLSKDADDEWISIEFDQSTKKITKISFKSA